MRFENGQAGAFIPFEWTGNLQWFPIITYVGESLMGGKTCVPRCSLFTILAAILFGQTNLPAQVALDPSSFIRQQARAYWWGHTPAQTKTDLPSHGDDSAIASQYNGNAPSYINAGISTYKALTSKKFTITAKHTMMDGGFLTTTSAIRFQTTMPLQYTLSGHYSAAGPIVESGQLNVYLKNIDTDTLLFQNNQTGFSLNLTGGTPTGRLSAILPPGHYEFYVLCSIEGGDSFDQINGDGSGQASLTLLPSLPAYIAVTNPGFEDNVLGNGSLTGNINGWTLSGGGGGAYNPPASEFVDEAPQGVNVAFSNEATISQIISEVLQEGYVYALIVEVGDRLSTYNIPDYTIELRAGGNVLASDTGVLTPEDGRFLTSAISYHAQPGDPFQFQVFEIRMKSSAPQTEFDAVRFVKLSADNAIENINQGTKYASVQAAINDALPGDIIELPPGLYREHINLLGKAVTLRGRDNNADFTIIDGLFTDSSPLKGPVLTCTSGEDPNTVIEGVTLSNGSGYLVSGGNRRGGGAYVVASAPTFRNCIVCENNCIRGGGMFLDASHSIFEQCSFISNHATLYGGAIYQITNSSTTISDTLFQENNSGLGGGAIQNVVSNIHLHNCQFRDNQAANQGGALVNDRSEAAIDACDFIGNTANDYGGAIYNLDSNPAITAAVFSWNRAAGVAIDSNGGALYNAKDDGDGSSPIIRDSIFEYNVADFGGAMLSREAKDLTIVNSIFRYNKANNSAGAIYDIDGTNATIAYCRFFANTAISGSGGARQSFNASGQSSRSLIHHCLFVENQSNNKGGAVNNNDFDDAYYLNCVFLNNTTSTPGGAVFVDTSHATIINNIFAGNTATTDADIHISALGSATVEYNTLQEGFSGAGNIVADPCVSRYPSDGGDGWGDNPATLDVDESANDDFGNLRLLPGSPSIDAGNSLFTAAVELDGNNRSVDDPDTPDTGFGPVAWLDHGPYEFGAASNSLIGDLNGDGIVNLLDLDILSAHWLSTTPSPCPLQTGNAAFRNPYDEIMFQ